MRPYRTLDIRLLYVAPEMRGVALTLLPQMPEPSLWARVRRIVALLAGRQ